MELARRVRIGAVSRRRALALLGAIATLRGADAAELAVLQPVSLDHVNIRVSDVGKSAAFYMRLFDTPVLRNATLRARPNLPASRAFFLKFGEGYLAIIAGLRTGCSGPRPLFRRTSRL